MSPKRYTLEDLKPVGEKYASVAELERDDLRKVVEAAKDLMPMFDNDSPLLTVYAKEIEQLTNAIAKLNPTA